MRCDGKQDTMWIVDQIQSAGIASQLAERGFARFALGADRNRRFTELIQRAMAELRDANALRPEVCVPGDVGGLGSGFHYFATNDPNGRPSTDDGQLSGLRHVQTWDHRAGTNPLRPEVGAPVATLDEAARIMGDLAAAVSRALASEPELDFARRFLEDTDHDGVILRTNISRGNEEEGMPKKSPSTNTRHIWHTDATLWTLLCLQDFAKQPQGVSATDRLVYEAKEGRVEQVEPEAGHVVLFPGRHLAALMDVSPPLPPWRHAVVSRAYSERTVVMLRIGFDPDASELGYESGRRLVTREGVDVGSGAAFYTHLQALQGSPLILEGSPSPRYGHRGVVQDFELVDA